MSIFKRNQPENNFLEQNAEAHANNSDQILGSLCTEVYCAEGDPSRTELSPDHEAMLNNLETGISDWHTSVNASRDQASELQLRLAAKIEEEMRAEKWTHQQRRGAEQNFNRLHVGEMAKFREHAIRDVNSYGGKFNKGKTVEDLAHEGSLIQLDRALIVMGRIMKRNLAFDHEDAQNNKKTGLITIGDEVTINPYHRPFAYEAMSRLRLAQAMLTIPAIMESLLTPSNIEDLPDYWQQFIATDISNGKRSLVLNFLTSRAGTADGFFEYLNENDLSPTAKEYARAISLGARALNGCQCPMNALGICKSVSDNIDSTELPRDIQDDMRRKNQTVAGRIKTQLQPFSQKHKVSQWWNMNAAIESFNPQMQSMNRGRSKGVAPNTTARSLTESLAKPVIKEIVAPTSVVLSLANSDELLSVSLSETKDVADLTDKLLASKMLSSYIETYRHDKSLETFLGAAINTIMKSANYRETKGIEYFSYRSKTPYYTADGKKLTRWRLSGKDFPGHSSDVIWSTRIYFAVSNSDNVRRIEIADVVHKTKTEKASKTGRMFLR